MPHRVVNPTVWKSIECGDGVERVGCEVPAEQGCGGSGRRRLDRPIESQQQVTEQLLTALSVCGLKVDSLGGIVSELII